MIRGDPIILCFLGRFRQELAAPSSIQFLFRCELRGYIDAPA